MTAAEAEQIDLVNTSLDFLLSEIERKDDALVKAADTFEEFRTALRLLRHETMAEAARIAAERTRAALGGWA